MAQRAAVNLSDLPDGDHLVKDGSYHGTCVVYMKLTEACVKAIDTLLAKKVKVASSFMFDKQKQLYDNFRVLAFSPERIHENCNRITLCLICIITCNYKYIN